MRGLLVLLFVFVTTWILQSSVLRPLGNGDHKSAQPRHTHFAIHHSTPSSARRYHQRGLWTLRCRSACTVPPRPARCCLMRALKTLRSSQPFEIASICPLPTREAQSTNIITVHKQSTMQHTALKSRSPHQLLHQNHSTTTQRTAAHSTHHFLHQNSGISFGELGDKQHVAKEEPRVPPACTSHSVCLSSKCSHQLTRHERMRADFCLDFSEAFERCADSSDLCNANGLCVGTISQL